MEFNDYQDKAHNTAQYMKEFDIKHPEMNLKARQLIEMCYVANGLGEVGEVQGKIKKIIRDKGGDFGSEEIKEIAKELGDVLWYIAEMCTVLNLKMDNVAEQNIVKLFDRKERGVIVGSGDNR